MRILFAFLILFAGCTTTITPDPVTDSAPSWDGNDQNSGFLDFNEDGSGEITLNARNRYNALIDRYGKKFSPPLKEDAGITTDDWKIFIIDAEHLVKFATMNRWRKQGVK